MASALVPQSVARGGLSRHDEKRLKMFRDTVAKNLNDDEFNQAVDWCEVYGANPFVRDIYFFVFDAKDEAKRRMVPVLGIGLYRKIAARTGDYRPDEAPPRFVYDETAKSPSNSKGIVSCEVTVYKFTHGAWHPTTERLRWEERAPIIAGGIRWEDTGEKWPDTGKPKRKKVSDPTQPDILDPDKKNWHTMPETMLAKCVEASALRKAWPEQLSGSYGDGELDQAHTIELTATEIVETAQAEAKLALVGGSDAVTVQWESGKPLARVTLGKFADAALEWARDKDRTATEMRIWFHNNLPARTEYKAKRPSEYLDFQREWEATTDEIEKRDDRAA